MVLQGGSGQAHTENQQRGARDARLATIVRYGNGPDFLGTVEIAGATQMSCRPRRSPGLDGPEAPRCLPGTAKPRLGAAKAESQKRRTNASAKPRHPPSRPQPLLISDKVSPTSFPLSRPSKHISRPFLPLDLRPLTFDLRRANDLTKPSSKQSSLQQDIPLSPPPPDIPPKNTFPPPSLPHPAILSQTLPSALVSRVAANKSVCFSVLATFPHAMKDWANPRRHRQFAHIHLVRFRGSERAALRRGH